MLTHFAAGGDQRGWVFRSRDLTDTGSASSSYPASVGANDSRVVVMRRNFYDNALSQKSTHFTELALDGSKLGEKILSDNGDAAEVAGQYALGLIETGDYAGYTAFTFQDSTAGRVGIVDIQSTGKVAVNTGMTNSIQGVHLSDSAAGDLWVAYSASADTDLVILDESAATDYVGSVLETTLTDLRASYNGCYAVNSSGHLVIAGRDIGVDPDPIILCAIDTGGTIQASSGYRYLTATGDSHDPRYIVLDASDNVYVFFVVTDASPASTYYCVAKFNSSLTVQWAKRIYGPTNYFLNYSMIVSNDGNYLHMFFGTTTSDDGWVVTLNTSDGSEDSEFAIDDLESNWAIGDPHVAKNSDSIFVVWDGRYGTYFTGFILLKCTSGMLRAGGTYGNIKFTTTSVFSFAPITMTTVTPAVSTTTLSVTQTDVSSDFVFGAPNTGNTETLTEIV